MTTVKVFPHRGHYTFESEDKGTWLQPSTYDFHFYVYVLGQKYKFEIKSSQYVFECDTSEEFVKDFEKLTHHFTQLTNQGYSAIRNQLLDLYYVKFKEEFNLVHELDNAHLVTEYLEDNFDWYPIALTLEQEIPEE